MSEMTFDAFTAQSLDEGFDEVLVREWPADTVLDTHTHPFDASVHVVRGNYSLTVGDQVRPLQAGDGQGIQANL